MPQFTEPSVTTKKFNNVGPRIELSGPSTLCDAGFVFEESVERCVEEGASFGDSRNLEGYLDDYIFGK